MVILTYIDPSEVMFASQILPVVFLGIICGLAFIPANIAAKKGASKGGFWVFGLFLFIPALIVALCINEKTSNYADELLKYKTLFDQGIISQSEFEAKKKELMEK